MRKKTLNNAHHFYQLMKSFICDYKYFIFTKQHKRALRAPFCDVCNDLNF